jgi:small-conductance mechanosensitive channel
VNYSYITLAIFVASVGCAWYGYTLLAVQILIWWTMQLTCILTITCLVGWMKKYSERHNIYERPINETWLFRFVYRVLLPWLILASVWISIYWAADVFNLGELTRRIMTTNFVDEKYLKVSILSLLIVIALYFLFGYLNRVSIAVLKLYLSKGDKKLAASRTVMGKNVIQVIVWGAWLLISLAIFHVDNTWLVVISGGLSTGIGFALKDIIENIYYGISLMAGRVKVGDWIEIDGTKGKVNSISYTSTMVESIDGTIIAFTNSQLFTKNYRNLTKNHGYVLSLIPFGVAYNSNMKDVMETVEKAVVDMKHPYVDKKKQVKVVFTEFGDSSINFKLLCWVDAVKQIYAVSDIMERIYDVLGEKGIQIPFPQRDVHIIS